MTGAPIFNDVTGAVVGMHIQATHGVAARDRQGVGVSIAVLSQSSQKVRGALESSTGRTTTTE